MARRSPLQLNRRDDGVTCGEYGGGNGDVDPNAIAELISILDNRPGDVSIPEDGIYMLCQGDVVVLAYPTLV